MPGFLSESLYLYIEMRGIPGFFQVQIHSVILGVSDSLKNCVMLEQESFFVKYQAVNILILYHSYPVLLFWQESCHRGYVNV